LAQQHKICPTCNTPNHRNALICSACGANISGVIGGSRDTQPRRLQLSERSFGDADLLEGNLRWRGSAYFVGGLAVLVLVACIGIVAVVGVRFFNTLAPNDILQDGRTMTPSNNGIVLATNTARPTLGLATVTLGPPTPTYTEVPTITPTQGPCVQEVLAGDTMIQLFIRCGHRDYLPEVVQSVVDENNLADANSIQVGQSIQIPWPTPTLDPNATATPIPTESANVGSPVAVAAAGGAIILEGGTRIFPTETLPPGITWHTVSPDENILVIAVSYNTSLRLLSDLNPQIQFSQCDFGSPTGGDTCVVLLRPGEQVRVPAPTLAPTLSPTPSGSETPTPTATPTFNVPTIVSPSDRAFFRLDDLITLRWIGTGALGNAEAYRVTVTNLMSGEVFTGETQELFFILPEEWRGSDLRNDYTWRVAVVRTDQADVVIFETDSRQFTWQGRGSA
jgi:hypothetical protein